MVCLCFVSSPQIFLFLFYEAGVLHQDTECQEFCSSRMQEAVVQQIVFYRATYCAPGRGEGGGGKREQGKLQAAATGRKYKQIAELLRKACVDGSRKLAAVW